MSNDPASVSTLPAGSEPVAVLKFGSSVLRGASDLDAAVAEIYRELRRGFRVLAVVSAFPGVTDRLAGLAGRRFAAPDPGCLARLLATGETASAALLGMALEEAGVPASVVDPEAVGLLVAGPPLDSEPVALDTRRLLGFLARTPVVVLPGFFGRSASGGPALLGRGGSDLTALFAAWSLRAGKCRLLKDVDGVYSTDPRTGASARRYSSISWEDAARVSGRLIQPKALQFARARGYTFALASACSSDETVIGTATSAPGEPGPRARPLRVALLGLGTVGMGVFEKLAARPDLFELTGIAVRNIGKSRDRRVPRELLTDDPARLLERPTDVVLELIGGLEPAGSLIRSALAAGRSVVTANKAVIARHGEGLRQIACRSGARLLYSASVGGAVPVLERVRLLARHHTIEQVSGVLNGTCNYMLEKLAEGVEFSVALGEAQRQGFAEADPHLDLSGADSAQKLSVLAHTAFGATLDPDAVRCSGIEGIGPERVRRAREEGKAVRLVATCRRTAAGLEAEVRPEELPSQHPLSRAAGVENRVLIRVRGRKRDVLLSGKGAGRWPTSLSVCADLLEIVTGRAEPARLDSDLRARAEMTA